MNTGQAKGRKKMMALGRLKSGVLNKNELAYQSTLEARRIAGEIAWYKFEGISFRIAAGAKYTPDFAVMLENGEMELHEVKGYWMDGAKDRIKVAADLFPFRFIAVYAKSKKDGGGWEIQEF